MWGTLALLALPVLMVWLLGVFRLLLRTLRRVVTRSHHLLALVLELLLRTCAAVKEPIKHDMYGCVM